VLCATAVLLLAAGCQDRGEDQATTGSDLEVAEAPATGATDDDGPVTADDIAPAPASGTSAGLTPPPSPSGGSDETTLSETDEKLASGQYYDAFPLNVAAGKGVELTVTSSDFPPTIVILDSNKEMVSESQAMNRDSSGAYVLRYQEEFPQGGQYFVLFTTQEAGKTGSYTVRAATTTTTVLN
jgi:hypothetical protein